MTPEQIAAEVEDHELAKLLIELAWLTPPGTNVKQHNAWMQLERYINAVRATAALRRQSLEAARLQQAILNASTMTMGLIEVAKTETPETAFSRWVVDKARRLRDQLDTALPAAPGSTPPELRDNGKPNRPHEYREDHETGMCVICGWAEAVHNFAAAPGSTPTQETEE